MRKTIHPNNWTCPSCNKGHTRPHWPDHHQEQPDWKANLDPHNFEKNSNDDFKYICEVCETPLTSKIENGHHDDVNGLLFCRECKEPRTGIPAPLFCPHCGWTQERLVLVKMV